jgi:YtxH-like protein
LNLLFYTGVAVLGKYLVDGQYHNVRAAKIDRNESKNEIWKVDCMREGNYEASEQGRVGTAVTFLLIGLGAGTLIGLLFAPKPGKQMRKELRRKYEGARETIEDWKEDAKEAAEDALERGAEIADDLRDRVTPLTKAMRRR